VHDARVGSSPTKGGTGRGQGLVAASADRIANGLCGSVHLGTGYGRSPDESTGLLGTEVCESRCLNLK